MSTVEQLENRIAQINTQLASTKASLSLAKAKIETGRSSGNSELLIEGTGMLNSVQEVREKLKSEFYKINAELIELKGQVTA